MRGESTVRSLSRPQSARRGQAMLLACLLGWRLGWSGWGLLRDGASCLDQQLSPLTLNRYGSANLSMYSAALLNSTSTHVPRAHSLPTTYPPH